MVRSAYHDHHDLLTQVADSREERDNVRRILAEPLLDAHERYKRAPFPVSQHNDAHRNSRACSRCDSGLAQCVTPDACERAELPRPPRRKGDTLRVIALWAACLAAVALTLIATGVRP